MGTLVKRNGKTRAIVRIAGQPTQTKTFDEKRDALAWMAEVEATTHKRAQFTKGETIGGLLARFVREVLPEQSATSDRKRLLERFAEDLKDVTLGEATEDFWLDTINSWKVAPGSRRTYFTTISGALNYAATARWAKIDTEGLEKAFTAAKQLKRVSTSRVRSRRITDKEIARIKKAMAVTKFPMSDIIDFTLITSMRRAEICRITWADFDEAARTVTIRDRKDPKNKKGNDQTIALIGDSFDIVKRQAVSDDPRIFPFDFNGITNLFGDAVEAAGLKGSGICFHLLRHEAISRMFARGATVAQVAKMSGHKTWAMLRRYTELNADDVHAAFAKLAA